MKKLLCTIFVMLVAVSVTADDCLPPQFISLPTTLNGDHCFDISFDFEAQLDPLDDPSNTLTFTSNMGSIDPSTGDWIYTPSIDDVITPPTLEVYISNGTCSDTGYVGLTFTNNPPTIISCPGGDVLSLNPTVWQIEADDIDNCDQLRYSIIGWSGGVYNAEIDSLSGELTLIGNSDYYQVTVRVTDGHEYVDCNVVGNFIGATPPFIELSKNPYIQNNELEINFSGCCVTSTSFDFLLLYRADQINFLDVQPGWDVEGNEWEYFTYHKEEITDLNSWAIPSEYLESYPPYADNPPLTLLRIKAIADVNWVASTPREIRANANLARIYYHISRDYSLECTQIPVKFFWYDCNDNIMYDHNSNTQYIAEYIFDDPPIFDPIFGNSLLNPIGTYPTISGPKDADCDTITPVPVTSFLHFYNGGIELACTDSISRHGDINLNNIPVEIGDYALLKNYFLYGISIFSININAQIAASDINADGLTLMLDDLALLLLYVKGKYPRYWKPTSHNITIPVYRENENLNITGQIAYAHLQLTGDVTPKLLINESDFNLGYAYDALENITRVLIYPIDDVDISFTGAFLDIGDAEIKSIELATADAQLVSAKIVPATIELAQNYPNPFNPTTTISFSLPNPMDITFTIYNIKGQTIYEQNGYYEAGVTEIIWDASEHASGVYFYKLSTPPNELTRKMLLLK